ncbi:hypothetical protein SEA_FORK_86 [Microbacterium phage Fork]|nr:hypothetical protein SEA_FORK_86 [Microbacterium phage Fork]QYC54209.1 hypothetical protein SEA_WELCOME_92 [Microbacterium phage Welcome]WNO25980.1 hypothetical protein SEA_ASEGATO_88 [Microbacterium phage ASegato]
MKKAIKTFLAASVALGVLTIGLTGCGIKTTETTTDCLVTDKYVQVSGKSSAKIVASSCGVFMVEDELSQGNWNSADVYAKIEVGKTYDFEAYGPRNGFLSLFPNINSATEVEATK